MAKSTTEADPSASSLAATVTGFLGRPFGESVSDWLEGHAGKAALAILAVLVLVGLGKSADTKFTYDEYVTSRTAALTSVHDIWRFFADGLDTTGPLSALIAHPLRHGVRCPELLMRLPFSLVALGFGLGMFGFLRRRYPAGIALAALLVPMEIPKVAELLVLARAYPIVLGCTGLAIWLWQSAAEGRGRAWSIAGLWLALALAMNAHFYAMLLVLPFALAQWVHEREQGRRDWAVWLALLLSPLGWLPVAAGELVAHRYYGQHFWAKADFNIVGEVYEAWLMESWPLMLVFTVFAIGFGLFQARKGKPVSQGSFSGLRRSEWVLGAGLILLPVYGWVAALQVGAFQCRYVLASSAGFILCLLAGTAELCRRNRQAGVIFFALIAVLFVCNDNGAYFVDGVSALQHPTQAHRELEAGVRQQAWVQRLSMSPLPVAVDNDTYRTLDFYAQPELAQRTWGLTDLAESETYPRAMTDQTNLVQFSKRFPVRTMDVAAFMQRNPHFLMVVEREPRHFEWLPQYLLAKQRTTPGLTVSLLDLEYGGSMAIYEVQTGAPPAVAANEAQVSRQ
jgi:hypothetical protein